MSGISFMGVGSGLPVNDIIKATVAAEAAPLKRLENDKKFYQSQISAMGQLSSRLGTMRTAMLDLRGETKFQQLAANSGNDKLFTATADHIAGATSGNYSVKVLSEASAYRWTSDYFTPGTDTIDGKITIDGKEVGPDSGSWTLEQLRSAINSDADLKDKVTANIVSIGDQSGTQKLTITAKNTGSEAAFVITGTGLIGAGNVAPADKANLNARIEVDGIEVSSQSNTFSNVVSGVTITVAQGAMNETSKSSTLEVKRDDKAIKDNINAFVKAYNDVIIHLNEAKKGSLYGDSTIRSVESELRNILYTPTTSSLDPGDPDFASDTQKNYLAILGIEVYSSKSYDPENPDSQNGTLRINDSKLTEMLENDFERVSHVIGASDFVDDGGIDGYAARFADLAQRLTSTTTQNGVLSKGLLEIRKEGLNSQVGRIDDKIDSTNLRLELLEARLVKQFSAIDGMVANLNSTGSWIGQQFANLPGYTRN